MFVGIMKNEHTWHLRDWSFSLLQKQQIKIIILIILACRMFCETNRLLLFERMRLRTLHTIFHKYGASMRAASSMFDVKSD